MSVIFGPDTFTVGADVNIDAYPATPDYAYNAGSGADLTVNAANDRVQKPNTTLTNIVARIINAAVPTGDQKIIADCFVVDSASNIGGQLTVRCKTDGSQNFYLVKASPSDDLLKMYRCDAASFTLLTSPSLIVSGDTLYTAASFKAVGAGSQVDLTAIFGGTTATFSDSNANRKTSGPPGISIWDTNVSGNNCYVDNVSVDDLTVPPNPNFVSRQSQLLPILAQ